MDRHNGKPGDQRGFIHKRIFGGIKGAIGGIFGGPGGIIGGAVGGFAGGGRTSPVATVPQAAVCPPGFVFDPRSQSCVEIAPRRVVGTPGFRGAAERFFPGGGTGLELEPAVTPPQQFGEAVMGRFGAALEPMQRDTSTRVCPRGTVLAVDGLCYNSKEIRNSDRMWPRGRRPLLTGGDMRCIAVAARAGRTLERTTKRLQKLGLMKKPSRSRPRALLAPGHHEHVSHD